MNERSARILNTPRRFRLPARSNTPAWLRLTTAVVLLLTLIAGAVLASASTAVDNSLRVIGHQTAPNVTATEDLALALSDMDAQVANILLAGSDSSLASTRSLAEQTYADRRDQASGDLEQATEVAGSSDNAQMAIREIVNEMGQYEALAEQTILTNDSEHNPAGKPSKDVLDTYHQANAMMVSLHYLTTRLTKSNGTVLTKSYQDTHGTAVATEAGIGLLGAFLVVALLALQYWLRKTVRRRINVGLAAATVVAAVLTIGGMTVMGTESHQLTVAKKDAFDSLIALRQARSESYDANADESRWLLDASQRDRLEQAFLGKSQDVARFDSATIDNYDFLLDRAMQAHQQDAHPVSFGGYLGSELKNITFPREQIAADQTLEAYQQYQLDDRTIRDKATTDLHDAIAFDTNPTTGSNFDFALFDNKLEVVIDINQNAFDHAIATGEDALSGWTGTIPYGAAALIIVLVLAGIWPRMNEYR